MPFRIIRDNIVHVRADVIVNSANPNPIVGGGAEADIYRAAGPRLERGAAVLTRSCDLPGGLRAEPELPLRYHRGVLPGDGQLRHL